MRARRLFSISGLFARLGSLLDLPEISAVVPGLLPLFDERLFDVLAVIALQHFRVYTLKASF